VIYGAGGAVGGAVARAFAREGARVFLTGRERAPLDAVVDLIRTDGGDALAEAETLDALDEEAVDRHAGAVAERAGGIDISFNTIGHGDVHGAPLLDMAYEDFARPVETALRAQFLTSRAAARHMVARGSGVIMAITATTARAVIPEVGGTGVALMRSRARAGSGRPSSARGGFAWCGSTRPHRRRDRPHRRVPRLRHRRSHDPRATRRLAAARHHAQATHDPGRRGEGGGVPRLGTMRRRSPALR